MQTIHLEKQIGRPVDEGTVAALEQAEIHFEKREGLTLEQARANARKDYQVWQKNQQLDFLDTVMQALAEHPASAPLVPNRLNTRVYIAQWKNADAGHRIFFREMDDGIYILRILHTAMDWPSVLSSANL